MLSRVCHLSGRAALLALAMAAAPAALRAQDVPPPGADTLAARGPTLTLDEAVRLARRGNPEFLQQANDMELADWAVRNAYGSLLPGAGVSMAYGYQAAGQPRFGNFTGTELGLGETTDYYSSSYSLGVSYRLSGASLLAPGQAKQQRQATEAGIEAAGFALRTAVTRQYIGVRRAQDGVALARAELARADENLRLAAARVDVGAAIPLEAQQAQVERGRAEVALLQAENLVRTELLRLGQTLGAELPEDVELTTSFEIGDVPWTLDALEAMAADAHPQLRAARAAESAAAAGVRMARSAYLPSLNLSAGVSGFARQAGNPEFMVRQARQSARSQQESCTLLNLISAGLSEPLPGTPADCSRYIPTPEDEQRIRDSNSGFDYARDPFSASLSISLPLFDGFSRERQVGQARVAQADAELRLRAERQRVRTEVATALHNATAGRRAAELEARNAELADEQLRLARERYRVGASSYMELQDAETLKARADRAHLAALYQFHESLAALEAAVGRSLTSHAEIR